MRVNEMKEKRVVGRENYGFAGRTYGRGKGKGRQRKR